MTAVTPGHTVTRNGLPAFRPYVRRAPRPAWMLAAIAKAEAEHGPPAPTCYCGQPVRLASGYGTCGACGRKTGTEGRLA
jgi:hypothetical protein